MTGPVISHDFDKNGVNALASREGEMVQPKVRIGLSQMIWGYISPEEKAVLPPRHQTKQKRRGPGDLHILRQVARGINEDYHNSTGRNRAVHGHNYC